MDDEARRIINHFQRVICLAQLEDAMKGIKPEDLLQAVQSYTTDSTGFTPAKKCHLCLNGIP
jgi:hypothetical protein